MDVHLPVVLYCLLTNTVLSSLKCLTLVESGLTVNVKGFLERQPSFAVPTPICPVTRTL